MKKLKTGVIAASRWVVITGCDSGFGLMTSIELAARGFGVIAACLTPEGQNRLLAESGHNPRVKAIVCDITDPMMVEAFESQARDILQGHLWGLVNNAGISIPGYIDYLSLEEYRKVMEINYFAMVNFTLRFLPALKASKGRIVNVGSTCGLVALPGNSPYNASKFAVRAFTDTLRREMVVWGVKVSLVQPGVMKTPITSIYKSTMASRYESASPEIQEAYGEEFAAAVTVNSLKRIDKMAQDPQKVVWSICHGILSRRPRSHYLPGIDARCLFSPLSKYPPWYADALVKTNGRKKPAAMARRGKFIYEFGEKYPLPPENLWEKWLIHLWKGGAGFSLPMDIEIEGDGHGNHCTRFIHIMGKHGIREGITGIDFPRSIQYTVRNPSWSTFPVSFHRGEVRFIPLAQESTAIVWSIEVTPKRGGRFLVEGMIKFIIPRYLAYLGKVIKGELSDR